MERNSDLKINNDGKSVVKPGMTKELIYFFPNLKLNTNDLIGNIFYEVLNVNKKICY